MTEWVSVKDYLPKKVGRYLIRRKQDGGIYNHDIKIEWFCAVDITSMDENDHRLRFLNRTKEDLKVTHWMELPEVPDNC